MAGLAKKLFADISGVLPKNLAITSSKSQWPLLEKALYERCLSNADLEISRRLLRGIPQANEAGAALLCHLAASSRKGHLCVHIDQEVVYPAVENIWISGDESVANLGEIRCLWKLITEKIIEGREAISLLLKDGSDSTYSEHFAAVYRYGDLFYLQRYWKLESTFLKHVYPLIGGSRPAIELTESDINLKIENLLSAGVVLKEQAQAIRHGCLHPFTILIGGPGTGKTYTAGLLIKVLWESLPTEHRERCQIALAAPTGKAAANLEKSIQKAMRAVEGFPELTGQTLHSLLGIGRNNGPQTLSADVLLIDECSMIDAQMMALLMKSLKPGARLIMLGDKHQLPPVEAGSLFAALVDVLQGSVECSRNVIELKACLRVELQSIIDLAKSVNEGHAKEALEKLQTAEKGHGLHFMPLEEGMSPKELQRQLLTYCLPKFPVIDVLSDNPLEILNEFSRFRMLTPLRKGFFGIEALNQLFFEGALLRAKHADCFLAPIMVQHNDYRTGLFNGEVGLLIKLRSGNGHFQNRLEKNDYALFASKSGEEGLGSLRKIPALLLPKFDYAYCLSVHKSQGSEFEHVLLLLPSGSEQFGREALYTGITRARQQLELWSNVDEIRRMIERQSIRCSGVRERFLPLQVSGTAQCYVEKYSCYYGTAQDS